MPDRHYSGMPDKRKIGVVGHLRGGKAVQPHNRLIEGKQDTVDLSSKEKTESLVNLAADETIATNLVARNIKYTGSSASGQQVPALVLSGKLEYVRYENCAFSGVDFNETDFRGVEFSNCTFEHCKVVKPQMSDSLFEGCVFRDVNFWGDKYAAQVWRNTRFEDCQFGAGDFASVSMESGGFTNCTLQDVMFKDGTNLEHVTIADSKLKDVGFVFSNLPGSSFERCDFDNLSMRRMGNGSLDHPKPSREPAEGMNLKIRDCHFTRGDFRHSNLICAEVTDCTFERTYFEKVEARQANFSGSQGRLSFARCNLRQADFTGIDLNVTFQQTPVHEATWNNSSIDFRLLGAHEYAQFEPFYENYSFEEAIQQNTANGLTDRRFEFMVLSGIVEVRDNSTMKKVTSGFDPDKHHIPPWAYEKLKKMTSE